MVPRAGLERLLEAEAVRRLERRTDFFVRTAEEWKAIIAANPFRAEAERAPSQLVVACLKGAPDAAQAKALRGAITGSEKIGVVGREVYIFYYPNGIGRSRLTTALVEKHLGTQATGRNWNTVLKLDALADG